MSKQKQFDHGGFQAPWKLAGLPPQTPVLLALSGGADSRALLHLLADASAHDGFPLIVAHVDHGIRGVEAKRDAEFCKSLAAEYGVELCLLEADVPTLASQNRRGLEEEARSVRYEFFERLMRERNIPLLATAHHADDNLETVLFRIARGSGLRGLGGIAPVRRFANGFLTRPLISVGAKSILEYCEKNGLRYVTDSTNADTSYARNRIRAEILPVLQDLFPSVSSRVYEMTEALRLDEELLSNLANEFLQEKQTACGICIDDLKSTHPSVARRVLMRWGEAQTGKTLETVHLQAIFDLMAQSAPYAGVALPGDHVAIVENGFLMIQHRDASDTDDFCLPFGLGEFLLPGLNIRVSTRFCTENTECRHTDFKMQPKVNNLYTAAYLNLNAECDIIKKELFWRPRKTGDKILMDGMHKKLRKVWNEAKISPRLRNSLPLLCDSEGIVWAPFAGARDGMQAQNGGVLIEVTLHQDIFKTTV